VASIHPTAIVDPAAEIAADVTIGPFCVIEGQVVIEAGCQLASHVVVKSGTHLGPHNTVAEGAVLGGRPQHIHAAPRVGRLLVGSGNTIREHATIHCGLHEQDCTVVGNKNFIMVNVHIAHDCRVGDSTIIANNAMIAGHVTVESRAYISGAVGIHQFCRIGQLAMVGGQAHITRDVPPFITVDGLTTEVVGLNRVGLQRNGFTESDLLQLKTAYRVIYRSGLAWNEVLAILKRDFAAGPAAAFYEFLKQGERGFVQERRSRRSTLRIFPPRESEQAAPLSARSAS
jgi:UDP-N-acetylglucosamine acyltransferase